MELPTRNTAPSFKSLRTRNLAIPSLAIVSTIVFLTWIVDASGSSDLVELSYTHFKDAPTHPKLRAMGSIPVTKGVNKYGIWIEMNEFCTSEHSGTHLDAPVHFSKDGWSVEEIPINRLFRVPGVMVDVSAAASKYSQLNNYEVQVRELQRWEAAHGPIPDGAVVFINTGWGKLSKNITAYSGVDQHGKYNFPGLSLDLARWLAGHGYSHHHSQGIVGVGIDTASLDVGQSVRYESHVVLLGHNIYGLENVANLDMLPPTGFTVTTLPLKMLGGSGSPVRIIAELGATKTQSYQSTDGGIASPGSHGTLVGLAAAIAVMSNLIRWF